MLHVNYWMVDCKDVWAHMAWLHGRCGHISWNTGRGWIGPWHQWAVVNPFQIIDAWRGLRRATWVQTPDGRWAFHQAERGSSGVPGSSSVP